MTTCTHHWYLSNTVRQENGERITHEQCQKCGGKRDLIESRGKKGRIGESAYEYNYTEITYPEKKEKQLGKRMSHQYYETRKDEIIAAYNESDKVITVAAEKLKINKNSLRGLLTRWGVHEPTMGKISKDIIHLYNNSELTSTDSAHVYKDEPTGITSDNREHSPQASMKKYQYLEANAKDIIADINSGKSLTAIRNKWGVGDKSLLNFRHRHGLFVPSGGNSQNPNYTKLFALFDKVLEQDDINLARAMWSGIKVGKGIE